jgi:hypothetical protein
MTDFPFVEAVHDNSERGRNLNDGGVPAARSLVADARLSSATAKSES